VKTDVFIKILIDQTFYVAESVRA